ncbi:prolyl oligopeptidase family serine peptidase [Ancylobacter sp. A5.8]|uniref:alpha/beta hydrolase family esterase n=1 Tax=Ancylobacter gelatini TaxID=2919920 RepID=UPI001F4DFE6F|nr:PHB depolymerase family esterase [Ancylobacter gelatini]MCJ8145146.1 prolyl oligopeptidase family serine peptidase [Ancylobacter gelatini]
MQREYILHVPKQLPPGPRPLVIALHGALQPASTMQRYLDLDAIADREGFIVAYPKGLNLLWNDGRSSIAGFIPLLYKRDDAQFVLSVLDTLEAEGRVDASRAYLMGFSNGGFLTAFMACRHAERFAAFATMMMTVPVGYAESCKPARPVPILMMNGTYDPIVPMFGRPTPGARLMSADESAALFARIDGCGAPQIATKPHTRITRWGDCKDGASVAYYEIAGGHQPPAQSVDAVDALASVLLGPRRSGLDAPEEIWSFFKQYGGAPAGVEIAGASPPPLPASPVTAFAPTGAPAGMTVTATPVSSAAPAALQPLAREPDYAEAWRTALGPSQTSTPAPVPVPLPLPSPLRRTASAQP